MLIYIHALTSVYIFPDFPVEDLKSNLTTFLKSDLFESSLFCGVLKKIAELMEAALDRQLADFLKGGVFGAQLDSNLVEI